MAYQVGKGDSIEPDPEELEAVALESKHSLEINEFVPKADLDELCMRDPCGGGTKLCWPAKSGKKRVEGQREMLLPISGTKGAAGVTKSLAGATGRQWKAG